MNRETEGGARVLDDLPPNTMLTLRAVATVAFTFQKKMPSKLLGICCRGSVVARTSVCGDADGSTRRLSLDGVELALANVARQWHARRKAGVDRPHGQRIRRVGRSGHAPLTGETQKKYSKPIPYRLQ